MKDTILPLTLYQCDSKMILSNFSVKYPQTGH